MSSSKKTVNNERGEMKQAVSHPSSKSHYTADACIVWCFDNRFSKLLEKFQSVRELKHVDLVKVAGGAKALTAEKGSIEREFILDQIAKSIKLHNTKRILLMTHSDCGAYGGLSAFGTEEKERVYHVQELKRASRVVAKNFSGIPIELTFANFEGLLEVL